MKDGSELLAHFQNIKDKGGGKYTCDCPICNRAGHVYVSIGRDSAALYCQGCKADGKQLAEAAGLKASGLFFKENIPPLPRRTHYYYFADGSLFGKKEIVKKPDGSKNCFARRLFLCFFMFVVLRCNLMTSLVLHAKICRHASNMPQIVDFFQF